MTRVKCDSEVLSQRYAGDSRVGIGRRPADNVSPLDELVRAIEKRLEHNCKAVDVVWGTGYRYDPGLERVENSLAVGQNSLAVGPIFPLDQVKLVICIIDGEPRVHQGQLL